MHDNPVMRLEGMLSIPYLGRFLNRDTRSLSASVVRYHFVPDNQPVQLRFEGLTSKHRIPLRVTLI